MLYKLTLLDEPILFIMYAMRTNELLKLLYKQVPPTALCGWWMENSKKVISLDGGSLTIEVENTFDVGDLPQITPNRQYKTKEEELEYALKRISNV